MGARPSPQWEVIPTMVIREDIHLLRQDKGVIMRCLGLDGGRSEVLLTGERVVKDRTAAWFHWVLFHICMGGLYLVMNIWPSVLPL
jgi:hypothetical protein